MLKIENLKIFSNKNIVLQVNEISFEQGSFSYIRGANSSGKSLFLKTLYGQYKNFKGNITFRNQSMAKLKNNILLINPELPIIKNIDMMENIQIPLGKLGSIQKTRLLDMASTIGIVDNLREKMEYTSRSERMLMFLMRATLLSPNILMIDDIDDYFDPETFKKVYYIITMCIKSGMIIITTGKSVVANRPSYFIESGELKKDETIK